MTIRRVSRIKRNSILDRLLQAALTLIVIVTVLVNLIYFTRMSGRAPSSQHPHGYPWIRVESSNKEGLEMLGLEKEEFEIYGSSDELTGKKGIARNEQGILKNQTSEVTIVAESGKDHVYISINNALVYKKADDARGLHIAVLSQHTGRLMTSRTYDTYLYSYDNYIEDFIESLSDGRILVFLTLDEASFTLGKVARSRIAALGSRFIDGIGVRDSWVFIAQKSGNPLGESIEKLHESSKFNDEWPPPTATRIRLPLVAEDRSCDYGKGVAAERRRTFCEEYDGYGKVCKCQDSEMIDFEAKAIENNNIEDLPVIIIASNRPYYLYRMLKKFLSVPGVNLNMVTVYIDDDSSDETAAICKLYNVNFVRHNPQCDEACRISQHYRRSLTETFDKHPSAKAVLILEEDLEVSDDIMDYFSQTYPLLKSDPTLICVSAWNDQGYTHTARDPALLYRVNMMPGLGWILKRSVFKDELEPKWPGINHELSILDWDLWVRMDENMKGRDCIVPDISRTFHFGMRGLNMNEYFHEVHFAKRPLNKVTGVHFNTDRLQKENYNKEMHELVRNAILLNHTMNQCTHRDEFIPNTKGKTYVAYIKMEKSKEDERNFKTRFLKEKMYETWLSLSKCFNIWDLSARGIYNGAIRFWYKENHIVIVGVPQSPYAVYKPMNIQPIFVAKNKN